jgi:hypothetical protein
VLHLGKTWDCGKSVLAGVVVVFANRAVVLLDEAEVFLQERSLTDLQRNALVAGEIIIFATASSNYSL